MSDVNALIEEKVRRIVRQEMRQVVNPTPGGPFHTVYVNAQGQVIKAEAGGGGLIVWLFGVASYSVSVPAGNTEDVILYGAPTLDTHSAVATSGGTDWTFTAPADGYYRFEMGLEVRSHAWAAGESLYFFLKENSGSPSWDTLQEFDGVTDPQWLRGVQTISLSAGDVIRPMWGMDLNALDSAVTIDPSWIAIYQV